MPTRKLGACGSFEIGRMSRISRTLRMLMPNVSSARPSVRYCAISAMSAPRSCHRAGKKVRLRPRGEAGPGSALKVGVVVVVGSIHLKGEAPATAGHLERTACLGSHRLFGAALNRGHAGGLAAQLADCDVNRRAA